MPSSCYDNTLALLRRANADPLIGEYTHGIGECKTTSRALTLNPRLLQSLAGRWERPLDRLARISFDGPGPSGKRECIVTFMKIDATVQN